MQLKDFYYDLPQELIAQNPLLDRASSRLMRVDKVTGEITHGIFKNICDYLKPGDCLVINDTKVIPARLFGAKEDTNAKIEVFKGLSHGFGLGEGTVAEGWIDHAVSFWEDNMSVGSK